jgi:hypothetical protein
VACAKLMKRCSDGVEDQGIKGACYGAEEVKNRQSQFLERAVSRERLFLSAPPPPPPQTAGAPINFPIQLGL